MANYICQFVGGMKEGFLDYETAVATCDSFTEDKSEWRAHGALVQRPELDNQPKFNGYIGPMWDGELTIDGIPFGVLRYETPDVYRMLSM